MSFIGDLGDPDLGLAALALACGALFAASRGGRPERLAGRLVICTLIATSTIEALLGRPIGSARLLYDTLGASAFLFVTIRYSSLWLGVALLIYSADLGLIAMRSSGDTTLQSGAVMSAWHAGTTLLLLLTLATATAQSAGRGAIRRRSPSTARSVATLSLDPA